MIRLDKYLADMGIGTRTEVKKFIHAGRIQVDGQTIKKPESKVDTEAQQICFDGIPVHYREYEYYMLHKPAGVVSATKDKKEKTVLDLLNIQKRKDLFPVGRLDKDTEGLLLITNDGALAHRLLAPGKHVDKVYFACVEGKVTDGDIIAFSQGLDIGDPDPTLPAKLEILTSDDVSEILLSIQEGRFHQVKRMFEAVGKKVIYLKRLSMGTLHLDETLPKGGFRALTEQEIKKLC